MSEAAPAAAGTTPTTDRGGLRALPLRWRLSIITAALVLVALVVSSVAVLALVRGSLVRQLDEQLWTAAQAYAQDASFNADGMGGSAPDRPSDYYVQVQLVDGRSMEIEATTADGATPDVTGLTTPLGKGNEISVSSTAASGPHWRVGVYTLFQHGDEVGTMIIAVPLTSVEQTAEELVRTMALVGLGVVVIAALAGYYAVQRSLRPLRDIETAAGAVAAGDLSRRAPLQPPTTEIGRLGLSFNTMVAELEESFAERAASEARMRRFVSDASHELRTPLAAIRGYGELYRMGAVPDEEVPAAMGRIESEATRMGGLVNDLLALARLDEGRGLRLADIDLRSVAADGVADLGALDPTRDTRLVAEGPVVVRGDGDRLRQVVTNLVGNTVQHTPPGTAVEVVVRSEDVAGKGWAVLEVRDHGPGISEADSARVFERFYRPDSSRTRASGGSGLGLAIVATIVAAHGGSVRHEPTPGGGATIVVRLPVGGPPTPPN